MNHPMNEPLLPLLAAGDRVRVMHGSNLGAVGTVQDWEDGKVLVKSDEKGTIRAIPPAWLSHIPGSVHSDPIPWDVGAEPLQDEIPDSVDSWGEPRDNDEQIGVDPLDLLTSTPTDSLTSPPTLDEAQPLHSDSCLLTLAPTNPETLTEQVSEAFEAEPLQALELLRERLQKTALTNAWLESAGRGYVRLVWHKSMSKPPEYVDAKDVAMWRDRIAAGRALAHCDALLKYLRSFSE